MANPIQIDTVMDIYEIKCIEHYRSSEINVCAILMLGLEADVEADYTYDKQG